jgi:beta-phosphoglucomutase
MSSDSAGHSDDQLHRHMLDLPVEATIFDFNGTLSDDEELLAELYTAIFDEHLGFDLETDEYYRSLAGLSDAEIVTSVLGWTGRGDDSRLAARLLDEKIRRYKAEVRSHPRIAAEAVEFVVDVSRRVPVAVVTGAARAEVDAALDAAGLSEAVRFVIAGEDVSRGKPDPEGYDMARRRLAPLEAARIVVFEDSMVGIRAAKAAGMQCIAVAGTTDRAMLAGETRLLVDRIATEQAGWFLDVLPDVTSSAPGPEPSAR